MFVLAIHCRISLVWDLNSSASSMMCYSVWVNVSVETVGALSIFLRLDRMQQMETHRMATAAEKSVWPCASFFSVAIVCRIYDAIGFYGAFGKFFITTEAICSLLECRNGLDYKSSN